MTKAYQIFEKLASSTAVLARLPEEAIAWSGKMKAAKKAGQLERNLGGNFFQYINPGKVTKIPNDVAQEAMRKIDAAKKLAK